VAYSVPDIAAILIVAASVAVPWFFDEPQLYSVTNLILIAVPATLSVYLMLRVNLLTFAVPAFMGIGGYASAYCALHYSTNLFLLAGLSFALPLLVALPLGVLVLRLRGVYFVLVTYIFTEIVLRVIDILKPVTGGFNGLSGLPAVTLGPLELLTNQMVLFMTVGIALVSILIAYALQHVFRDQLEAIRENEVLTMSLGLTVWHYHVVVFCVAAGLAGLAGFSLVNMLLMAHPSSFSAGNGIMYIAYAIVGGQGNMLGVVLGAGLLVWATTYFSISGEYSIGLFGTLVIVMVLLAPEGIVGLPARLGGKLRAGLAAANFRRARQ
jgi:branched-chain amino acid transport system permease protein